MHTNDYPNDLQVVEEFRDGDTILQVQQVYRFKMDRSHERDDLFLHLPFILALAVLTISFDFNLGIQQYVVFLKYMGVPEYFLTIYIGCTICISVLLVAMAWAVMQGIVSFIRSRRKRPWVRISRMIKAA